MRNVGGAHDVDDVALFFMLYLTDFHLRRLVHMSIQWCFSILRALRYEAGYLETHLKNWYRYIFYPTF